MNRLLALVTAVCGERSRQRVFEPMLADWQRELALARSQGRPAHLRAAAAGALALVRALVACAIADGVWLPPAGATALSMLAIGFSVAVSTAFLLVIAPTPYISRDIAGQLAQRWVLVMSATVLPPAFLLAMFMHRRDPRSTLRHGIVGVSLTAVAMIVIVARTNPEVINRRYNTFEFQDQMRARMIEVAKSDPDIWKGRSLERTLATTVEERRASYDRMQARFAEFRKNDPPPTRAERFAHIQPILLSIVFATMGWMLGGTGRTTVSRGLMWWALVFITTITMSPLLSLLVGVPMPQPAQWWLLPMFTSITLVLVAGTRTTRRSAIRGES
jgi:hypothetical protein